MDPVIRPVLLKVKLWHTRLAVVMGCVSGGAAQGFWDVSGRDSIQKPLRHALVEPDELGPLRAEAVRLFQSSRDAEKDRVLSLGLAAACYPFLQKVAATIGRMLRVQPEIKLEQLLRKLSESFEEKETVRRSGRYSLSLIQNLGFEHRTKKAGCYLASEPAKGQPLISPHGSSKPGS